MNARLKRRAPRGVVIKWRWLWFYAVDHSLVLRVFNAGFGIKDTRRHPLTFSERNGYKRHWLLGGWSFTWLDRAPRVLESGKETP